MTKAPQDSPTEVGQRVRCRKTGTLGKLITLKENNWCYVNWETEAPMLCHLFELQAV